MSRSGHLDRHLVGDAGVCGCASLGGLSEGGTPGRSWGRPGRQEETLAPRPGARVLEEGQRSETARLAISVALARAKGALLWADRAFPPVCSSALVLAYRLYAQHRTGRAAGHVQEWTSG